MLKRMCRDDRTALDALDKVTTGKRGGDQKSAEVIINTDIISIDSKRNEQHGTQREYALRKLRDDAPSLHARVLAGELSPHAAMLEAGFRKRTISILTLDQAT